MVGTLSRGKDSPEQFAAEVRDDDLKETTINSLDVTASIVSVAFVTVAIIGVLSGMHHIGFLPTSR